MKRAAAIAALLLVVAGAAAAKILVIADNKMVGGGLDRTWVADFGQPRDEAIELHIMKRFCDFDVVSNRWMNTLYARTGTVPNNFASAGAGTTSYPGVVMLGWHGKSQYATGYGKVRVDSMTIGTNSSSTTSNCNLPTVPFLAVLHEHTVFAGGGTTTWNDGGGINKDSLGVSAYAGDLGSVAGLVAPAGNRSLLAFCPEGGFGFTPNATPPAGGFRSLLYAASDSLSLTYNDGLTRTYPYGTLAQSADTVMMFERLNSHVSGAARLIVAAVSGTGTDWDSTAYSGIVTYNEFDPMLFMAALAHLDSLTGGAVFKAEKLPIKLGLGIVGGFSRSTRTNFGGIDPADASNLRAVIDSMAARHIPATLLANLDSVATYATEKAWWSDWAELRYAPYSRLGIDTTAAGLGAADSLHDVDVFGRWRYRAAYTPGMGSSADTSVYGCLRRAFARCDSIFGSASSRAVFPPDGDWSPLNAVCYSKTRVGVSPLPMDSVLYAIHAAGGKCIVHDSQNPSSDNRSPMLASSNPCGYIRGQQLLSVHLSDPPFTMPLLGYSGHGILAGRSSGMYGECSEGDTAHINVTRRYIGPWTDDGVAHPPFLAIKHELNRTCYALLCPEEYANYPEIRIDHKNDYDDVGMPKADALYGWHRGSVLLLSVNDLVGNDRGVAPRNGWWTVKALDNWFQIINAMAGRTVFAWDYVENIQP